LPTDLDILKRAYQKQQKALDAAWQNRAENLPLANQKSYTLVKGRDTPQTPGGYQGRAGLYEVMEVTEEIQQLIIKHATSHEVQKVAMQQGMITMRQDGYLKALNGITTIEEVNRVAADTA